MLAELILSVHFVLAVAPEFVVLNSTRTDGNPKQFSYVYDPSSLTTCLGTFDICSTERPIEVEVVGLHSGSEFSRFMAEKLVVAGKIAAPERAAIDGVALRFWDEGAMRHHYR